MSVEGPTQQEQLMRRMDETLVSRITSDYNQGKTVREDKLDDIESARKLYNSEWQDRSMTEEAKKQWFYVPKVFSQIQTMLSEMLATFFRKERFAEVDPSIARGEEPTAADMMDDLLYYYWDLGIEPYDVLRDTLEAGLRDGTSVMKSWWDKEVLQTPNGPVPVKNEPRAEHVPLENVLWDPVPQDVQDIRWFIHEKEVPIDELYRGQSRGIYQNIDKVSAHVSHPRQRERRPTRDDEQPSGGGNKERQTVLIKEFWGETQLLPDDVLDRARQENQDVPSRNIVCTIANKHIIRPPEPNPYADLKPNMSPYEKLPFFLFRPMPKDNSTWGRSLALKLKAIQRETNKLRNQRRQIVDQAMGGKVFVNTSAGSVDRDKLESPEYMGVVDCEGNPNEIINTFEPGNMMNAQSMEREESTVDRDTQKITGVTHPQQGVALSKRQTRGEVEQLMQKSSARLATLAEAFNHTGVVPVLKWISRLIVKYVEPEEVQEILNYQTTPPPLSEILDRDFHIRVRAGIRARSRKIRIQDLEHALQVTGQVLKPLPRVQMDVGLDLLESLLPELGVEASAETIRRAKQMVQQAGQEQFRAEGETSETQGGSSEGEGRNGS